MLFIAVAPMAMAIAVEDEQVTVSDPLWPGCFRVNRVERWILSALERATRFPFMSHTLLRRRWQRNGGRPRALAAGLASLIRKGLVLWSVAGGDAGAQSLRNKSIGSRRAA
jgi:hypothetical protein